MTKYWNESYETLPREQLDALKLKRLKDTVQRVYERVPFYRTKFQEMGLDGDSVESLDDLKRLPFTTKTDLRDNYPYDLFAEPLRNIVRLHASSGTTGKPVVDGYTKKDLNMWAEIVARALVSADADRHSVIQNAYGYGLFTGGLGIHGGAERLGASIIPISGGNTQKQLMLMQDFGTTHLTCTPSYAQFLGALMPLMSAIVCGLAVDEERAAGRLANLTAVPSRGRAVAAKLLALAALGAGALAVALGVFGAVLAVAGRLPLGPAPLAAAWAGIALAAAWHRPRRESR